MSCGTYYINSCLPSLVGHGLSDGARVDIKDFDHYVEDLIHFVTLKKQEHPDIPLYIMGHSMVTS